MGRNPHIKIFIKMQKLIKQLKMARVTGLEPATSGVTGRHSNQLSYTRILFSNQFIIGTRGRVRGSYVYVKQTYAFF